MWGEIPTTVALVICCAAFMWGWRGARMYDEAFPKPAPPTSDEVFGHAIDDLLSDPSIKRMISDAVQEWRDAKLGKPIFRDVPLPPDVWKKLLKLAHPDHNDGSELSTEVTAWLIEHRPE